MDIAIPTEDELVDCVVLGKVMWEEGDFGASIDFSEDNTYDFFVNCRKSALKHYGQTYFKVAKRSDGLIVGMVLGFIVPYFYNNSQKMARDQIVFVHPAMRRTSAAYRLINDFKAWAVSRGANELLIGVSSGVDVQKTHDFFNKMGYDCSGGVYRMKFAGG